MPHTVKHDLSIVPMPLAQPLLGHAQVDLLALDIWFLFDQVLARYLYVPFQ